MSRTVDEHREGQVGDPQLLSDEETASEVASLFSEHIQQLPFSAFRKWMV